VRKNKADERQRKREAKLPLEELPFHRRRECVTTYCGEQLTSPLHRMRCKHRICEHCVLQQLRRNVNCNRFCHFATCAGYLPAQLYAKLRAVVMAEKFRPWMSESETAPPSEVELQCRRDFLRSKRVRIGDRVSQKFTVQYTCGDSQLTRCKNHTYYGKVLSITEDVHLRVMWERSEFDGDLIRDQFGLIPIRAASRCRDQRPGSFV